MKGFFLTVLSVCFLSSAIAQIEREEPQLPSNPQIQFSQQRILGKIMDEKTGRGLEAASVQLFVYDSTGKDSLIRGQFTRSNGEFAFEKLPQSDSFRVVISGVGYRDWSRVVRMNAVSGPLDLGNISIAPESQVLNNVVITARTQPPLQMGIDRKIFSVESNITASGGTALDVMRNIPSVTVDAEGSVQLRNAAPQVFVDGRPTI